MSEKPRVQLMLALELLVERAARRDDKPAYAIADEASARDGFAPGAITDMLYTGESHEARHAYREEARRRRNRSLLRAKAEGMLLTLRELIDAGVLDGTDCANARHALWAADQPAPPHPAKNTP